MAVGKANPILWGVYPSPCQYNPAMLIADWNFWSAVVNDVSSHNSKVTLSEFDLRVFKPLFLKIGFRWERASFSGAPLHV